MTSLSSSSRSPRIKSLLPLMALAMVAAVSSSTGCADKHIGRPCVTAVPDNSNTASVNPQALECPSRICLLPAQTTTKSTTGPLCTDYCSSDDDCSDAEKYDATTNPKGCMGGFACRIAIPNLETSALACKRVCVCKDFLLSTDPDLTPPKCKS